ncbi:MAG TPA: ABC transporter permease [Conexibacter sp.]|jgi:ribose transport system permease protein|nr:ABC transporter permease [Conexibacter sp.]
MSPKPEGSRPADPTQSSGGVLTEEPPAASAAARQSARPVGSRLLERLIPRPATADGGGVTSLDRSARRRAFVGQIGVPLMGLALIVVFSLIADNFLTGSNIKDIFSQAALPLIVATGLTICLSMGEFDLSLNGVAGLATVLMAVLVARKGMSPLLAIPLVLALGVGIGAVNGVLVGYFGVAALIVTIAVNSILQGWEFVVSGSVQIFGGFPPGLVSFARGSVLGIPTLVLIAAAVAWLAWVLLERTTLGRHLRAIGGNAEAARIAGVNTARVKLAGFIITALLASLAGLLFAARETNAYPLNGLDVLLPSFAACFIGAAMFKIGEFNIPGTIVGVMIAQITANGLILLNVATYASYFFQGIILLIALLFARVVVTGGRST